MPMNPLLNELFVDGIFLIIDYLKPKDICRFAKVNKYFFNAVKNDYVDTYPIEKSQICKTPNHIPKGIENIEYNLMPKLIRRLSLVESRYWPKMWPDYQIVVNNISLLPLIQELCISVICGTVLPQLPKLTNLNLNIIPVTYKQSENQDLTSSTINSIKIYSPSIKQLKISIGLYRFGKASTYIWTLTNSSMLNGLSSLKKLDMGLNIKLSSPFFFYTGDERNFRKKLTNLTMRNPNFTRFNNIFKYFQNLTSLSIFMKDEIRIEPHFRNLPKLKKLKLSIWSSFTDIINLLLLWKSISDLESFNLLTLDSSYNIPTIKKDPRLLELFETHAKLDKINLNDVIIYKAELFNLTP